MFPRPARQRRTGTKDPRLLAGVFFMSKILSVTGSSRSERLAGPAMDHAHRPEAPLEAVSSCVVALFLDTDISQTPLGPRFIGGAALFFYP